MDPLHQLVCTLLLLCLLKAMVQNGRIWKEVVMPCKPSINIGTCITCIGYNILWSQNYTKSTTFVLCLLWESTHGEWVVQGLLQKSCDCTYGITISTFCCVSCVCTTALYGSFFGRHVHAISLILWEKEITHLLLCETRK
jgi:hypothetical protein